MNVSRSALIGGCCLQKDTTTPFEDLCSGLNASEKWDVFLTTTLVPGMAVLPELHDPALQHLCSFQVRLVQNKAW